MERHLDERDSLMWIQHGGSGYGMRPSDFDTMDARDFYHWVERCRKHRLAEKQAFEKSAAARRTSRR